MWSYRDGDGQQQYSGRLQCVNDAQLLLRGPQWAKTVPPPPSLHQQQPHRWYRTGWIHAVAVFTLFSEPIISSSP